MGMVLTDEVWTLQNFVVVALVVAWFIGWTVAAKNMLQRTDLHKREMVNLAAREINTQKQQYAKQTKVDNKKSK
jgi:hypothetical protein